MVSDSSTPSAGNETLFDRMSRWSSGRTSLLPGITLLVLIGISARFAATIVSVNALIIAIIIGLVYSNVIGLHEWFEEGVGEYKLILEAGIVLMGARLALSQIIDIGPTLLLLVLVGIMFTVFFAEFLSSSVFGIDKKLGSLIACGSGICGVSAIVAVAGSVKAKEEQIAYAVATILLFDVLTLFSYPIVGTLLQLPDKVFGIWAGITMFSTGPVAAAGFAYSDTAGQWATITKLTRNLFIGFVAILYSIYYTKQKVGSAKSSTNYRILWEQFPKFIPGFILFMLLASVGFFSSQEVEALKNGYNWLFAFAFAGLGLNIRLNEIHETGGKPVVVVLITLLTVSSLSLVIIYSLFG